MAGLDLFSIQEAITARLRAVMPNYEVHEDAILDDKNLIIGSTGTTKSYLVVRFGIPRRSPGDRSMAGHRQDGFYSTVDVSAVGATGRIAREVLNLVHAYLEGWAPEGGEKLAASGGTGNFVILSADARPTAYIQEMRFRFNYNGQAVGSTIPPLRA
jgi:hypothetical protein